MREARVIGIRRPLRGGSIKKSNIQQLEKDFAKLVSFGKAEPPSGQSAEAIRKKFSI